MESSLNNAYTKVIQILNILGDSYKNKIPQKLIELFESKQNLNFKTNIKKDIKIENIEISRTALIIISILNIKYWATNDEKEFLKKIYDEVVYNILYKQTMIGVLEIREDGMHKYTPNITGIQDVKNEVSLIHEMLEGCDWRDPIPFFQNRIDRACIFSHEDDITTHTDHFRMLKVTI